MNYFSTKNEILLVPPLTYDGELKKIDSFLTLLDDSNISEIILLEKNKDSKIGRKGYDPFNLTAAILYCFAMHKGTLREIEDLCKYDIRLMYIMQLSTPSHKTICEFINQYILPHSYEIFNRITSTIINKYNIDTSIQYVDGTKMEANANKYKYVWKPTKYHENLKFKIQTMLMELDSNITNEITITSKFLNNFILKYEEKNNLIFEKIIYAKGHRNTKEEKILKQLYTDLAKLIEYEEKEKICGENRNSYYKTDIDATAMALKTDYYSGHGSNMHAAYNIQIMVASDLITTFGIFQNRSDYYTFIPLMEQYKKYYLKYPEKVCADSGYGIYNNYKFMQEKNIMSFVKFQQWNGESSGERPQLFSFKNDDLYCLNNIKAEQIEYSSSHQKEKGYNLYKFEGCENCGYEYKCKAKLKSKNENFRIVELNKEYELLKENSRKNLLSNEGIVIRVNRSIQVEGTFGQLKQNMSYVRLRRRGIKKVICEIMLMALGINLRKFFSFESGKQVKNNFWKNINEINEEKFPIVKQKRSITKF